MVFLAVASVAAPRAVVGASLCCYYYLWVCEEGSPSVLAIAMVVAIRPLLLPVGGPSSAWPVLSCLNFRTGVARGSATVAAALVVFFLGGILPLLALLCPNPHRRRAV